MELWGQQEGESDADYAKFLIYRNLGPARTIDAAYEIYSERNQPEPNEDEKGLARQQKAAVGNNGKKRAAGDWNRTYYANNWKKRAEAWDIHSLSTQGKEFVHSFYQAITGLALLTSQSILEGKIKPDNWTDLLNGLTTLGNFISPEALTAFYGGLGPNPGDNGLSQGADNEQDGVISTSGKEATKATG